MVALDPRLNPFRPDLAARHLQGKVDAARFVEGTLHQIVEPRAALRREPAHDARQDTEALYGERFVAYEVGSEGWTWGQLETDGYVGYIASSALGRAAAAPTHKVSSRLTFAFPVPDIKMPPLAALPFGARITVTRQDERFAQTAAGYFIPLKHLVPVAAKESDFVAVAERLLEAPYLWGGKTGDGIDCSGLVQVALQAAGVPCPRDSDMQEFALGKPSTLPELKRGDLVFWKGHVAIAKDGKALIHANAHHMMVASEPADVAIARIKASGSDVTSIRRL